MMLPLSVLPALLLSAQPASACGGFFCNQDQPVLQNAERIVFAIDEEEEVVESHVQIFYEGPSEEFAWIVPVPAVPELWVSSDALFDTVARNTAPSFDLEWEDEGVCKERSSRNGGDEAAVFDSVQASSVSTDTDSGGINVIDIQQVGAYETVTLQASSSAELLEFLQSHGYDLPADLDPVLQPYVVADAYFVALRLAKDKDSGDLTPLGMRYPGTEAMVPIQLTSVSATPNMRLEAYVFANERVVPSSYLHVQINDAAMDWWSAGSNYAGVITEAANEAGGHAFATDFAGTPANMKGQLFIEGNLDLDSLRQSADAVAWIYGIQQQGFAATQTLLDVILNHVVPPAGVDAQDFVNCPDCYEGWDAFDFDSELATTELDIVIVQPLRDAEALFDYPFVSRLTSSLDAVEMTVDPVFVLNPDMTDDLVDTRRTAKWIYECNGKQRDRSLRRLELVDGRKILVPSEKWMAENGGTPFQFISDLGATKAQIIEQTGDSGEPNVLVDHTANLAALTAAHNEDVLKLMGCGCSSTGGGAAGTLGLLALLGLGARRRRQSLSTVR